jgi:hypothetical protein
MRAKELRLSKKETWFDLSELYKDKIEEWNKVDRTLTTKGRDGQVRSPYRQNPSKGQYPPVAETDSTQLIPPRP